MTDIGLPDYIVANVVGIGAGSQTHLELLDSASLAFTGYDLETELGPLPGTGISPPPGHTHHSGAKADTTAVLFELDNTSPVTITFAFATVTLPTDPPVSVVPTAIAPEPSCLLLLSTGALGVIGSTRRRAFRAWRREERFAACVALEVEEPGAIPALSAFEPYRARVAAFTMCSIAGRLWRSRVYA